MRDRASHVAHDSLQKSGCHQYLLQHCRLRRAFLFIASGFLLAQKMERPYGTPANLPAIRKTLKKIVRLYLIWSLIYLPLAIANYISTSTPFFEAFVSYSVWFVIVGEHYNSWMLWYLLATIYALIYVSLMSRKNVSIRE